MPTGARPCGTRGPPGSYASPDTALGAVLVEHAQPTVYCVAGRHPTVILTTAARQALDAAQLEGVLAHERAHLAWHHHRLLAAARIGLRVLPFMPLMRDAEVQVERLVELHADDVATRVADPSALAAALVVLAAASPAPAPAAASPAPTLAAAGPAPTLAAAGPVPAALAAAGPAPTLAAAGPVPAALAAAGPAPTLAAAATGAVQRIRRLLAPAEPLAAPRRMLLRAQAAGLVLLPALLALAPALLALVLGRVPHA